MKVAIAVIIDDKQRILITQRSSHGSHGGMWEFPGGKLEGDETPFAALIREVHEEVGLDIIHGNFLGEIHHAYPNHSVSLLVYCVTSFTGNAVAREMQMDLRWVEFDSLKKLQFPAANVHVIDLIAQFVASGEQENEK